MKPKVSVIVPVYNSERSLQELYQQLSQVLPQVSSSWEIILVDDGSQDGSYRQMQQLRQIDPRVKLIQLDGNFGQQNALLCGFQFASGDIWVTLDDDLQHPPEELPKLMTKLEEGYEAVFGIPNQKQHSGVRNLGSQVIDLLLTLIAHKPRSIKVSSFRVLNNRVGQAILNEDVSFVYLAPLIFRNTRCTANVIVRHEPRKFGRSNYSYGKLLKLAFKLVFFYSGLARFFPSPKGPQYKIRNILR